MRRFAAAAVLMIAATIGLTGCDPAVNGLTGITVDDQGNLVAVFAWCGESPPDAATLYIPGGFNGDGKTVARYRAPRLNGQIASVRLDAPTGGWVVHPPAPALHPGTTYDIYGGTLNNTTSTSDVEFHLADRDRLAPGTVLIQVSDSSNDPTDALISTDDFQKRARTNC